MEKQNINIDQQLIFPPWKLEGRGIILIYNLKKSCISPYLSTIDAHHLGGFSVLMLVDYQTSPIGPYHELLFIPGKFRIGKTSGYHISFIRVSTEISTINGIHHWAIPKKTGSFNVEYEQRLSTWNMNMHQESFYGKFEHSSLSVPVFSHVLPYQLIQQKNNNLFTIRPLASGFAAISKVKSLKLDIPELSFLSGVSPFFACNISQFKMMFPLAKIVNK